MAAPLVSTVVKTVTHRVWNDIEPKVLTFLATGLSADVVIRIVDYFGFHIDPGLALVISTCVATVAGYAKASTSKVTAGAAASAAPAVAAPVAPAPVEAAPVVVDSSAPVA